MAELGVGYISIIPETSKITPGIKQALSGAAGSADAEGTGRGIGTKLASGIGKTLKIGAGSAAVAAGGVVAGGIAKGMGRLTGIENATQKLSGLGNSAEQVQSIMDNALASVKGTAFGLEEAASTAAMAVAAGVKPGKELEGILTTVADTAAIAGASMADMGQIFGSVAARGKLQGDDLMQLQSRGIPVLQLLAEQAGKTAEEISEMVSKGKIDFRTFADAMEAGVGGSAQKMGETFQGAVANMGAALGRVGATALNPFFDLATGGFGSVTDAIDGFNDRLKPVMSGVTDFLQGRAIPAMKEFGQSWQTFLRSDSTGAFFGQAKSAFEQLYAAGRQLLPTVVNLGQAFGEAAGMLGLTAWDVFLSTLKAASGVLEAVAGPLETVSEFLSDHPALVAAGITAWTGFKTVPGIIDKVTSAFGPHIASLKTMGAGVKDVQAYYSATGREIGRFGAAMQLAATSNNQAVAGMGRAYSQGAADSKRFGAAVGGVKAAMSGVRSAATGVMGLFGGPWGLALTGAGLAFGAFTTAAKDAERAQQAIEEAALNTADAYKNLRRAVVDTEGALSGDALTAGMEAAKNSLTEFMQLGEQYESWYFRMFAKTDLGVFERLKPVNWEQWDKDKEAAEKLRDSYKELQDTMQDLGISNEDLNRIVAEGGKEYENLIAALGSGDEAGQRAAAELSKVRDEIQRNIDAGRKLDPTFVKASEAIEVLADASSSANDKLNALNTVLQIMGLMPDDAERAMRDAAAAVDEIAEAAKNTERPLEQLGASLFDASGNLDYSNKSARDFSDQIDKMAQQIARVKSSGGDANKAFNDFLPTLETMREEWGLLPEQMDPFIDRLRRVSEVSNVVLSIEGSDEVIEDVMTTVVMLEKIPDGQSITLSVDDADSIQRLRELGLTVEELPDGQIEVSVQDVAAQEALDALGIKTRNLPGGHIEITDTSDKNIERLRALGLEPKEWDGKVVISDNAQITADHVRSTLNGLTTQGTHKVNVDFSQTKGAIVGNASNMSMMNANGSVRAAADGLLSRQQPMIAPGGANLLWAEDETEGESFIPHALSKRGRATQILAETAGIFGLSLLDKAGQPVVRDGSDLSQQYGPITAFADGGTRKRGGNGGDGDVAEADVEISEPGSVLEELSMISQKLADIGEGQTVEVDALSDEAQAALEQLGLTVEQLPDSVTVSADTSAALAKLDALGVVATELGDQLIEPSATLDAGELEAQAANARKTLDDLAAQTPTANAGLLIGDLEAGSATAHTNLDGLAARRPEPHALINTGGLDAGVDHSTQRLQVLGNSKATSVSDVNNQSALTNINAVITELNKMPVERVIRVVAHGSTGGLATGGKVPGLASGGRHDGYKLPTTGPGTGVVDGFMGLDSLGMPSVRVDAGEWVINRDSSRDYDRELAEINAGVFPKLPGYATGGKVGIRSPEQMLSFAAGQQVAGEQAARSLNGAPYDWGGINWGDCSGAMSALARFAVGVAPFAGRFATMNQREALSALGFSPGLGPSETSFNVGWYNGGPWGGHTSGDVGGVNVEMGGSGGGGKIGGAAQPASSGLFTDHAHIRLGELVAFDYFRPLAAVSHRYQPAPNASYVTEGGFGVGPGGDGVSPGGLGVKSTSTDGITLGNGQKVPWSKVPQFATGGRIPTTGPGAGVRDGFLGVDASGAPSVRVDAGEWVINRGSSSKYDQELASINAGTFPKMPGYAAGGVVGAALGAGHGFDFPRAVKQFEDAARTLGVVGQEMQRAMVGLDTPGTATAGLLGRENADKVFSAINLQNVGGDWIRQSSKVQEAESKLRDVRASIAAENTKVAEAEQAVADARRELAEARAGDDEEARVKAEENLRSKEQALTSARTDATEQARALEDAERAIVGARLDALSDMAQGIGASWDKSFGHLADYFGELAKFAEVVEKLKQDVAEMQMQQVTNQLNVLKAQQDVQLKELDIQRARQRGAISVAQAEAELENARQRAALMGETSIEAMAGAMDRFGQTGVFEVGRVSESVIQNSLLVHAAQLGVYKAEAQASLDALEAARKRQLAEFQLLESTLVHSKAAQMLQMQTAQLAQQTAQLYGMTSNQASGASRGFGGVGRVGGGIGKIIGGLLAGAAGFATAGPLGALAGAGLAAAGLGDLVKGSIDIHHNKKEMGQAWSKMGGLEKLGIVAGSVLGGGAAIGGAALGPEGATMGAQIGADIIGATVGGVQHNFATIMDKQQRQFADERQKLEMDFAKRRVELEEKQLRADLTYNQRRDKAEAEVEYWSMLQKMSESKSAKEIVALRDAAEAEAKRAGIADEHKLDAMRRTNELLEQLKQVTESARGESSPERKIVAALSEAIMRSGDARANQFTNARLG
ncbi:tape measure protein [Corynebacterium pseudodiphtheriticum]|uniref:tape measure protein n=1 Tax=Corynebacterium pseudodiphtheriticum TaxID=37637 RepID=UPI002543EB73|nr:tape measure protein [Corynebacterium pseudodiphtheriticum]MDK4328442.1 tape measure protein [Corynebacterium pseudodiphtheriticum]